MKVTEGLCKIIIQPLILVWQFLQNSVVMSVGTFL